MNNPQTTGTSPIEPNTADDHLYAIWGADDMDRGEFEYRCRQVKSQTTTQVLSELLDSLPKKMGADPTRDNDIDRGQRYGFNVAIDQVTEAIKLKINELSGVSNE